MVTRRSLLKQASIGITEDGVVGTAGCIGGIGIRGGQGSDTEIRLGTVHPLIGPAVELTSGVPTAVEMAVEEINEEGIDINGSTHQFNWFEADGACEPEQGRSAVRKLINQNNIDALAGPNCSGSTKGSLQVVADHGIPQWSPGISPELDKEIQTLNHDLFWFIQGSSEVLAHTFARYHAAQANRIALLGVNNAYGRGNLAAYETLYDELNSQYSDLDISVVAKGFFPHGPKTFSPLYHL